MLSRNSSRAGTSREGTCINPARAILVPLFLGKAIAACLGPLRTADTATLIFCKTVGVELLDAHYYLHNTSLRSKPVKFQSALTAYCWREYCALPAHQSPWSASLQRHTESHRFAYSVSDSCSSAALYIRAGFLQCYITFYHSTSVKKAQRRSIGLIKAL